MSDKIKNIILPVLAATILLGAGLWITFAPQQEYSASERRALAKRPKVTMETILSGRFQSEFEAFTQDQFPLRDGFRTVKAVFSQNVVMKKDNHKLYYEDGYLVKMEYPMNIDMLDNSVNRFSYLNEKYLKPNGITPYLVIVPDKNYFLAGEKGYLSMDYEALMNYVSTEAAFMKNIDIRPFLEIGDYYYTDTHWRQEQIVDVAEEIANQMGVDISAEYTTQETEIPFYGVYYGQAALPVAPDKLFYLTTDEMKDCIVTNYDTGVAEDASIYNLEKAQGKDGYELFLEGSTALITIENPHAKTDKELVIFRDSFGSSIAPLFLPAYSKITLVDIRYIQSGMVGNFVSFENADVLFLYSSLLLNSSLAFK